MTSRTMKAAVCREIGGLLTVEEFDVPKPGPRQVLVKLAAASLCSTDISVIDGMFGSQLFPVILGHEAVGIVVELGPGSDSYGLQVGHVIGAPPYMDMCLDCHKCKSFGPDFCSKKKVKGISAPGYFAEYSLVDAASAVIVADREADVANIKQVSPIFCAGVTVWDALERGDIKPGQTVAIIGLGGLGQLAAKYAHGLGAKVFALDVQQDQLDAVKGFTDGTVNLGDVQQPHVNAALGGLNNGHGADVVIVTAGVASAYQTALSIVEPLGRIVVVGLPKEPLSIHAGLLSAGCHKLVGARIPGQAGSKRCLEFSLRQGILPSVNQKDFHLEDLNDMIKLMREGKVAEGRMVVVF